KTQAAVDGKYRNLFEAAVKGDWKFAEPILDVDPEAVAATVMTVRGKPMTVLEVAIMTTHDQFVENLVKLPQKFSVDILERALVNAASRGRIRMVNALVDKVDAASESIGSALRQALSYAPMRKEVIWSLVKRMKGGPTKPIMVKLVMAGHLDIVLYLAPQYGYSTTSKNNTKIELLKDLVKMDSYFYSGARFTFLENCIYRCIPLCLVDTSFDNPKDRKIVQVSPALKRFKIWLWNHATKPAHFIKRIGESKLTHKYSLEFANLALSKKEIGTITPETLKLTSEIVLEAAYRGNSEIVKLCLKNFPELMWDKKIAKTLIQEVVNGRQVELFRLANTHLSDGNFTKNGLMKVMTKWTPRCASPDVSGAAFLMQRELQWYKV
ncbi:hypothetical protein ACJRO7_015951, partial [Eucalyptus globulus]